MLYRFTDTDLPELIINVDLNMIITDVSSNCHSIIGYHPSEMIGGYLYNYVSSSELLNSVSEVFIHTKTGDEIKMHAKINTHPQKGTTLTLVNHTYSETINDSSKLLDILESIRDIVFSFNIDSFQFEYLNSAVYYQLGYTVEEYMANPVLPFEIIYPQDYHKQLRIIHGNMDYSKAVYIRLKKKAGPFIWFENHITPIYNQCGELIKVHGISRNVDWKVKAKEQLLHQSNTDTLTGLYNRKYLEKEMRLLNNGTKSLGVIVCDLDNLKKINDHYGHIKGDELIKETATLLKRTCQKENLYRMGGDEFLIMCKDISESELIEKLRVLQQDIQDHNTVNPNLRISLSMGSSYSPNSWGMTEKLISKADSDMYINKRYKKSFN